MTARNTTVCKYCGRPIVFGITRKNRRIPLDPAPHPQGNIKVDGDLAAVLTTDDLDAARAAGQPLHRAHFVSCVNFPAKRKGRRK